MPQPSILIADDCPLVREALCSWLSATFPDCRLLEAQSGDEAIRLALTHFPAVVVMDLQMPLVTGLKATECIKAVHPEIRIVIFTVHSESIYAEQALAAGADDFVAKDRDVEALLAAIHPGLLTTRRLEPSDPEWLPKNRAAEKQVGLGCQSNTCE